jgi:hypothetical protein
MTLFDGSVDEEITAVALLMDEAWKNEVVKDKGKKGGKWSNGGERCTGLHK